MNSKRSVTRYVLTRALLVAVLVGGIALAALYRDEINFAALQRGIAELGFWAPIAYMGLYAITPVFLIPGLPVTLAGGAIFGPLWGTVYALVGATIGATFAFLAARYLAGDWVERKAHGFIGRVKTGIDAEGWRFVAFVRLVPIFPFNVLNYALGLTRIPLSVYIITSFICMAPAAVAYVYLGYVGREALAGGGNLIQKGLIAVGLLAVIGFLPAWFKRLRQRPTAPESGVTLDAEEIDRKLRQGGDVTILDVRLSKDLDGPLGRIEGSIPIPLEQLPHRVAELSAYRDRPIVTVCRAEKRSGQAATFLRSAGFSDVRALPGGMEGWVKKGFPIIGKENDPEPNSR